MTGAPAVIFKHLPGVTWSRAPSNTPLSGIRRFEAGETPGTAVGEVDECSLQEPSHERKAWEFRQVFSRSAAAVCSSSLFLAQKGKTPR